MTTKLRKLQVQRHQLIQDFGLVFVSLCKRSVSSFLDLTSNVHSLRVSRRQHKQQSHRRPVMGSNTS